DARRDVMIGVADDRLHPHRGRDLARDPGLQRRHGGERILDAGPARLRRQTMNLGCVERLRGRLGRRRPALVGHGDVRQRIDQPAREVVLRADHQCRHHDGEADTGGNAGDGETGLPHMRAYMRESDIEDEVHGADATRTRAPSLRSADAGAATRSPSTSPLNTSTARVPRMPASTVRLRTRLPSTTNTALPCKASAGTSSAFAFSRVTILASTLMPGCSGVSAGSVILTLNVLALMSPIGVISLTLPSSRRPGKASVRNSTV